MSPSQIPEIEGAGLLFMADPHFADNSPGQRLDGYFEQILAKVEAGLDMAREQELVPVFLGDMFHWPRDNSNRMLVELMRLFVSHGGAQKVWALVGNHDKHQSRLTDDVSLAVLETAGALRLMKEQGPQFVLRSQTDSGVARTLVCASPDGSPIPKLFERPGDDPLLDDPQTVLWLTHHNIRFPEFLDRAYGIKELPGIDWVINGHIHRPQQTVVKGCTTWANPGNISRLTFSRHSLERVPRAHVWTPGCAELAPQDLPHLPFAEVFPDQELPPEQGEGEEQDGSRFIRGLERLAWRRTNEGVGLRDFLKENLDDTTPEDSLVWELYEEVMDDASR
ncbi:metallophosphoesterase family protein [Pseudodesulfovibrio senegalensis]|jgi:hypothetical protein|uniref:Metallophosphoesterase n=1 Tax=Pseudodesulfovibrio senegalensis TaxID=1721087 RepID=A0A6N6N1U8_9BACT|nr:metallophosphoesterase [Pseudodesulfovibrio senegalensis]KAB1441618.1 metallophosphoesterase [Pseudodesulfovibrio senegalensis]